jgi:hypothetical protein
LLLSKDIYNIYINHKTIFQVSLRKNVDSTICITVVLEDSGN